MNRICIIPARGSSKRLPRKNILPFNGSPLLSHVIAKAKHSGLFDKIIVSSEDSEILQLAMNSGAKAFHRKDELAQDSSTVVEVCLDVLGEFSCEVFCCIYATSVLLSLDTLQKSALDFKDYGSNASVLMGVSKYNHHPVQALELLSNGSGNMMFPEYKTVQSQFYPNLRVSNGTFYWGKTQDFFNEKTFYSKKLKLFDVPENEVCDIDTQADYRRLLKRDVL